MADNRNDMIYSAADFERYYSGNMPEAEMHALEKAALEDPFLQDALDGFAWDNHRQTNLSELHTRFEKTHQQGKSVRKSIWAGNNARMLRAAAIIAFIAGTAYFIFKQAQNGDEIETNNPALADHTVKNSQNPVIDSQTTETIQQPTVTTPQIRETITEGLKPSASRPQTKVQMEDDKSAGKQINQDAGKELSGDLKQETAKKMTEQQIIAAEETNDAWVASGKVVNSMGEPIANAVLEVESKAVPTDSAGNFSVHLTQETRMSNVAALGYEPQKMRLKAADSQVIVLNNSKNDKFSSLPAKVNPAMDTSSNYFIQVKEIEPQLGWANYQEYVKKNIRNIPLTTDTAIAQIYFRVDEKGNPIDIYANPNPENCLPCNAEAIRLLKEGPLWKFINRGKTGQMEIKFFK